MLLLDNPVQHYAWGLRDGLSRLLGTPPSGEPEAELWVGTHPRATSVVAAGPLAGRSLAEVVSLDPMRWLGTDRAEPGAALPFLLKVLAIGEPLSLQAHPSAQQASVGFAREETRGVAPDAPDRTYRDRSAKPEVLVALAETFALCGFREPGEVADLLQPLGDPVAPMLALLRVSDDPLRDAMSWLLQAPPPLRDGVAKAAAAASAGRAPDPTDPWAWVADLAARYPGDPTAVAPLLLELVHLVPGQAVHLPAGNLHAYLLGAGIEVMAASDNVLRGGLTPKHVDVDELLHVLRFEPGTPPPPRQRVVGAVRCYDAGEEAFGLAAIVPEVGGAWIRTAAPSILLPIGDTATIAAGGEHFEVGGGRAVLVEPGVDVLVRGRRPVWWATTGAGLPS